MRRKVVTRCPLTGRTQEEWQDCGRGVAVPGHGRPTTACAQIGQFTGNLIVNGQKVNATPRAA